MPHGGVRNHLVRLGRHFDQEEALGAEVRYASAAVKRVVEGLKGLRGDVGKTEDVVAAAVVDPPAGLVGAGPEGALAMRQVRSGARGSLQTCRAVGVGQDETWGRQWRVGWRTRPASWPTRMALE